MVTPTRHRRLLSRPCFRPISIGTSLLVDLRFKRGCFESQSMSAVSNPKNEIDFTATSLILRNWRIAMSLIADQMIVIA